MQISSTQNVYLLSQESEFYAGGTAAAVLAWQSQNEDDLRIKLWGKIRTQICSDVILTDTIPQEESSFPRSTAWSDYEEVAKLGYKFNRHKYIGY